MLKTALLLALAVAYSAADSDLTQSAYLDVEEKFYIEWQYTDTNITILAKVKTTGWFGIGFSPNGGMAGADIITASVVNGKAMLQDRYAERNGYPSIDESQDVQLLDGSEVNGVTSIKFTRKHNTCDDKDMLVGTDTMRVIYAISADGSDNLSYHTPFNRGTRSVFLRRKFSVESKIPDNAVTFDITNNDVEIPAVRTTYFCEIKKARKLKKKFHIIKVEPLIQKENKGLVHHILLYGCYDNINRDHYFERNQTKFTCNANMPKDIGACRSPINAWAVGGGPTIFPEEAGFPVGGDNSFDYYMMETHYDNPQLLSGRKDNSGLRLTLTNTLRKYDAGILETGTIQGIVVPPKLSDFTTSVFCSSDCTKKYIKEDLTVFGAVLHGHLAARQVIARQFRDGRELRTIDEDRHYDFNYQQYKNLEKPVDLKPGDEIMVQCHYNTQDRTQMTLGGLPTTSEMCLAYLSYYPAQEISQCMSIPYWRGLNSGATTKYIRERLGYRKSGRSVADTLKRMIKEGFWTEEKKEQLENDHFDLAQVDKCTNLAHKSAWRRKTFMPPKAAKKPPKKRDFERCPTALTDQSGVIG